jgi:hypothetical protein
MKSAYKILVGNPEGKRPLGRPRCKWGDVLKWILGETGYEGVDWINLAQEGSVAVSCEHGNEHSSYKKPGNFFTS